MKKLFLSITSLCATASLFSENLDYSVTVHDKKMQGTVVFGDKDFCFVEQDDIKVSFKLEKAKIEGAFVLSSDIQEKGESISEPCLVLVLNEPASAERATIDNATGAKLDEVSLFVTLYQ